MTSIIDNDDGHATVAIAISKTTTVTVIVNAATKVEEIDDAASIDDVDVGDFVSRGDGEGCRHEVGGGR